MNEVSVSSMGTNGEMNYALAALGFTTVEQNDFNMLMDEARRSTDGLIFKSSANARMARSCLLRDWLFGVYDIFKTRHASDSECTYYCRPKNPHVTDGGFLSDKDVVFKQMSFADMKSRIIEVHKAVFGRYTASSDLSESVKTTLASITDLIDGPTDRYVYVGMGWAVDRGETLPEDGVYKKDFKLIDLNEEYLDEAGYLKTALPAIFYKLFDTLPGSIKAQSDIVSVPPLTPELVNVLKREYKKTLRWLNTSEDPAKRPAIPNKLDEIDQWACGVEDRYRDIIHMASARLKKHDYGVYFLTGLRRNGKSSCLDLMASMYGVNNICRVCVDDLGDYHNLNNFKRALMNLPDEQKLQGEQQKVMSSEAVKAFRISAAHSSDNMSVMRSNQSDIIDYGFVTAAPVNRMPNFPAEEKAACLDRCRIIEFQGDFSASDKLAVKWGKAHFTPNFMMRFTGQVLAYANYYSTHPWVMTNTMTIAQQKQYENSASNVTYMKMWERIFCGFDSYRTLFNDYANYCTLMDVEKTEFGRNSILLVPYNMTGIGSDKLTGRYRFHYNKHLREEQEKAKKERFAKAKRKFDDEDRAPNIMYKRKVFRVIDPDSPNGDKINITDGKTIEDFHAAGKSIIFELEDRGYFSRLDEQEELEEKEEQLRLGNI